jgi:hypothetical protein
MGLFRGVARSSISRAVVGVGRRLVAQNHCPVPRASSYRLFRFDAATRAREATTVIPRTSGIPKLGGCRAILHISGCGWSLKAARSSKSFSCVSRIYRLFRFGAATRASEATTVIPRTSKIVPKLGVCRALGHISGFGWSLKTARVTPWGNKASHLDQKTLGRII